MRYVELNEPGRVGDKKFVDGITYIKERNGKWKIFPNKYVKVWLRNLYYNQNLTIRQVSEVTGIPHSSLQRLLNELDLMRSKKKQSLSIRRILLEEKAYIKDSNFKYVKASKVAKHIREKYNINMCTATFMRSCRSLNIKFYSKFELRKMFVERNIDYIRRLYLEEKESLSAIISRIHEKRPYINMKTTALKRLMRSNGIRIRTQDEAAKITADRYFHLGRTSGRATFSVQQSRAVSCNIDVDYLTYVEYKHLVKKFTHVLIRTYPEHYSFLKCKDKQDFDIDHIFSSHSGYYIFDKKSLLFVPRKRKVTLDIMAHPCNLQLLPSTTNGIKGASSWQTLKELKLKIENHSFKLDTGDFYGKERKT